MVKMRLDVLNFASHILQAADRTTEVFEAIDILERTVQKLNVPSDEPTVIKTQGVTSVSQTNSVENLGRNYT